MNSIELLQTFTHIVCAYVVHDWLGGDNSQPSLYQAEEQAL